MEVHFFSPKALRLLACIAGVFTLQFNGLAADKTETETKPETVKPETATAVPASADTNFDVVANSVVKIFSTTRYPEMFRPWEKSSPSEVTGSGVVIEGKRILSNAHVVLYASRVEIQANQSGDKISATVEAIAPGIDLAVLKVDDESFFDTHPPLPRAKLLPEIKDATMVYGYPEGGTSLSITKGIVSRIEFAVFNYPVSGLRIQIDAAINPGNSGGPAIVGDKMIGLAFSRLISAQSIGYIIPSEEIDLFLKDIADGHYDGKPAVLDTFQTLENPALRSYLKLDKSMDGILVHKPASDDGSYPLKEWDLITKIGDKPVDNQGMVKMGANLRLYFTYFVQKTVKDGKVPLTIVRQGKEMHVDLPVSSKYPMLLRDLGDSYPPYFIFGPMAFTVGTKQMAETFSGESESAARWSGWLNTMGSPLLTSVGKKTSFDGEELVVIPSPFFPHKLSKGYSDPQVQVVKAINGVHVKNLAHLVQLLRDCKDEFIVVEFENRFGETMVFPRAEMMAATDDVLNDNGIRSQGSPDTLAIWNAKGTGK
ncbi:MAG TPA: trypsin-like peptidase domain-containing protein [Verrucomicrobiae bacterium]|nr:trypsin-like peptidase domain-containing protein [Verrucomicrobiae bacterium]